jgi:hypothetical protein
MTLFEDSSTGSGTHTDIIAVSTKDRYVKLLTASLHGAFEKLNSGASMQFSSG